MNDYNQLADLASKATGIKGFAKKLTYAIIILVTAVGILGSFTVIPFDMDAYVKFLPALAWLVVPLVVSIGANSAVDKLKQKDQPILTDNSPAN